MLVKCIVILSVAWVINADVYSEEVELDTVLNYLLNGDNYEMEVSSESEDADEPVLIGGIWKCGNCDNIEESRLIYSEVNEIETGMVDDPSLDIQIGVSMSKMKCVTVHASEAGAVRRLSGACAGPSVTLTVGPVGRFTLQVYGD